MISENANRLFAILALLLLAPASAHAYLDPATGSIILQAILGGVAGAALMVKIYWHKLLSLFGRKAPDEPTDL